MSGSGWFMQLIYFDESGNSGNNLADTEQPVFVLGALLVPSTEWQNIELQLEASLAAHFPDEDFTDVEIHAADLRGNRGRFRNVPPEKRILLRDAWLRIAQSFKLRFVYRSIEKRRYLKWLIETFGHGVVINPHVAAFALLSTVINDHLSKQNDFGIFISDENKEVVRDLEKSIRQLRLTSGPLQLTKVIEKGFFIDSASSRVLQLCDLCVLHARKREERNLGIPPKPFDTVGIEILESFVMTGIEQWQDVLNWLKDEQTKRTVEKK